MFRTHAWLVGVFAAALFAGPAIAQDVGYDAFQWYSAYDHDIRGEAGVYSNDDGSYAAVIELRGINPGMYHYRLVVPTSFRTVPPGDTLTPATWMALNVCDFQSKGKRTGCKVDAMALGDYARYLEFGVVEIWTVPANPRTELSRKWATAPLFPEDEE